MKKLQKMNILLRTYVLRELVKQRFVMNRTDLWSKGYANDFADVLDHLVLLNLTVPICVYQVECGPKIIFLEQSLVAHECGVKSLLNKAPPLRLVQCVRMV